MAVVSAYIIYSPNMLGCQEAKDFFCNPAVPAPGLLLNYVWYRAKVKGQKGNGQWNLLQGKLGGDPRTSSRRLFRLAN